LVKLTDEKVNISFKLNGKPCTICVNPFKTLVKVLREDLNLTGTKEGCGQGECGACTILLDGKPVNSCLIFAPQVEGKEVTTIEGLHCRGELHPIQEAFIEEGAIQCGFCTPGFIMSSKALLETNPHPTKEEIKVALAGNLCRCTGYAKIVSAVENAALRLAEKSPSPQ